MRSLVVRYGEVDLFRLVRCDDVGFAMVRMLVLVVVGVMRVMSIVPS